MPTDCSRDIFDLTREEYVGCSQANRKLIFGIIAVIVLVISVILFATGNYGGIVGVVVFGAIFAGVIWLATSFAGSDYDKWHRRLKYFISTGMNEAAARQQVHNEIAEERRRRSYRRGRVYGPSVNVKGVNISF